MNTKGARPIPDKSVKEFLLSLNPIKDLYNSKLPDIFLNNFINWILSSKKNYLNNFHLYHHKTIVLGTVNTFDHFYLKYKNKRFRYLPGEFMYHSACFKNNLNHLIYNNDFAKNDAFILSVPFSDVGSQLKNTNELLELCNKLKIPVLLDFAYYPCTKNINLDLNQPCIDTITFSISKAFFGAEFLRVGVRLQKENIDDGIDVVNSVEMLNRMSLSVANSLISKYSVDYNWEKYNDIYKKVCNEYELVETDCIMFGLGDDRYKDNNRGGLHNRVTVSDIIGNYLV